MTGAVVGLVASYVALATLLLSLNLKSAWRWPVKAAAIGVTAAFFVVVFFELHAALIEEPDRQGRSPGAIYLWLSPRQADGATAGPPRAYALPYSRALHEATARAQAGLQAGRPIDGKSRPGDSDGLAAPSVMVELFERTLPPLPPKTG